MQGRTTGTPLRQSHSRSPKIVDLAVLSSRPTAIVERIPGDDDRRSIGPSGMQHAALWLARANFGVDGGQLKRGESCPRHH